MTHIDYEDDQFIHGEDEWQPGECDNCTMSPGETTGHSPISVCCACSIGQGAPPDECRCGPKAVSAP